LGKTTLAHFDQIIRTNLTAVFFTVQAALPYLSDNGSVILNGSVHAVLGMPDSAGYAATKAGVRAMTRNFATDLAPRGIRVNQVTPGGTRTPIWENRAPTAADRAALEARISRAIPFGRFGEADELAQSALFLASDESRYITGSEIVVDGGATGAPAGAPIYRG
jgi:NAD(P)-dependent dehydrogenase (short-subunit alcohol dehydrogenase family)